MAEEEERFSLKGKLGIKGRQNQGSLTHTANSRPTRVRYRGSSRLHLKREAKFWELRRYEASRLVTFLRSSNFLTT